MTAPDELAEVLRAVPGRPTISGDYYFDMARAAREHIAAEIETGRGEFSGPHDAYGDGFRSGMTRAARIARGGTP